MLVRISTLEPWQGERIGGIAYPASIEQVWTAEELEAVDLAIPLAFVPVAGKVTSGPPIFVKNEDGTISTTYALADEPVPETLSRWQFFTVAAMQGIITQADALAAIQSGTLPAKFVTFIATLPAEDQFQAEMLLSGVSEFHRHHPFVEAFLAANGMTDAQADAIWTIGAALGSN